MDGKIKLAEPYEITCVSVTHLVVGTKVPMETCFHVVINQEGLEVFF